MPLIEKGGKDDKKALSICLIDDEGNAYVVFRGTGAGNGWITLGRLSNTEQQRRALVFAGLPDDCKTLITGHSKGNKLNM